ncbi:MAG: LacI family DNA-binding transcriptional regulator [Clostridia bacterium]|nr:LacI family DNA-binding transcriptional regulator [Clostridia bacterium]
MANKRVGLKDIAEASGMSVGNVSMVLRGLGDKARISPASQERILKATRELNYQPNVYAKRLRMQDTNKMIVAVFFATSRHVGVMGSFFSGIHEVLAEMPRDMKPELTLYPYTRGHLVEEDALIRQGCFNGLLFMGMSREDMDYIEKLKLDVPIVVFNRVSEHHHYVYADNGNVGQLAARLFYKVGLQRVCLVTAESVSTAGGERRDGFISECAKLGLELPENMILSVTPRYEGGKEAAERLLREKKIPEGIFFAEDLMAMSAQHYLLMHGLHIPQQVRIVGYSGSGSELYAIPSISSLRIPMEEMSRDCLILLRKAVDNPGCGPMNIIHKPIMILNESTGDTDNL